MEEITTKVYGVFERVFNVSKQQLSTNMVKDDFETWDSIGHLQLVMNLESEFGIKLRMDEINNIQNVQDCIDLVAANSK